MVVEIPYEFSLSLDFSAIHLVFHVSILQRYMSEESHVLCWDSIQLYERLTFIEESVSILARHVR